MESLEPRERPPWIIAHRGVSARFPENTRAAFDAAIDAGADALELDLQLSGDGELVVCHDRTLERFGHPHRCVRTLDAAALQTFDLGTWFDSVFSAERMPTFAEVLPRYGRLLPLCLELKVRDETDERKELMIAALLDAVAAAPAPEGLYILSFDVDMLERLHVAAPRLRLVWNQRHGVAPLESDLATRDWLFAVDLQIETLTRDLVQMGRDHRLVVLTYTCNIPREIRHALDCGVDAIITDDPEATRAVMLEKT